ncbi:hypothetical protein JCM3775_006798 [Rhodotorula graminis]
MRTSLLSLPDELLDLVVDQALGEYAPRLYKERQDTCRALSLVNKRVGAIAQPKLVEVVHAVVYTPLGFRAQLKPEQVPRRNCVRTLWLDGVGLNGSVNGFLSFAAVRDLRLTVFREVRLEDFGLLPEIRTLVLAQGHFSSNKPLVAPKLERLVLYQCSHSRPPRQNEGFTAAGCPSLRHLYLDVSHDGRPWPCSQDLLDQVDTLGSPLTDALRVRRSSHSALIVSGSVALDKVLFDLDFMDGVPDQPASRVRHLRVHADSDTWPSDWARLADNLVHRFPSLKDLYLPLAVDASRVMLGRPVLEAVRKLVANCERARVVVVYEHALSADGPAEDRAAPHFEARSRRVKAERAAAAAATTTSATSSGARAVR